MEVVYRISEQTFRINPELLVIACDPRHLKEVMQLTPEEENIFGALENFTFFTTCLRVRRARVQDRVVVFDPALCGEMKGVVHGYRNETAKQYGLARANSLETNLVVVYQIVGTDGPPPTERDLSRKLHEFLSSPPSWWPFDGFEIVSVPERQPPFDQHQAVNPLYTPYFNHFSSASLNKGLPWKWLNIQGANKTIYIHGSTCFESVLHCWSYIEILKKTPHAVRALPRDKGAPIVIVGAGVSGLLFARYLKEQNYTNVTLLEQSNRYGGKTHSLMVPDANNITVCELGTCYMSPAYDDMVNHLKDFTTGNDRFQFGEGNDRGIVVHTDHELHVMSFYEYALRYACSWLGHKFDPIGIDLTKIELAVILTEYTALRLKIFRSLDGVMPINNPGDYDGVLTKNFAEFLDNHSMGALKGALEYVYQIQGYGSLSNIPAYYGLVWVTPNIAWPFGSTAGVTAWKKGWEDVWEQMVTKLRLNVRLNATISTIKRDPIQGAPSD